MKNENGYPEKERFGRFNLNLKDIFEKTSLTKELFEECLKHLRDTRGEGWLKDEATGYLITGKAPAVMYAYGWSHGRRYRRRV